MTEQQFANEVVIAYFATQHQTQHASKLAVVVVRLAKAAGAKFDPEQRPGALPQEGGEP